MYWLDKINILYQYIDLIINRWIKTFYCNTENKRTDNVSNILTILAKPAMLCNLCADVDDGLHYQ